MQNVSLIAARETFSNALGQAMPKMAELSPSIGGLDGMSPLFLHQPLGQRDEFIAVLPVAQLEEASHQPEAADGRLVGLQCCKLWRHLDAIHC